MSSGGAKSLIRRGSTFARKITQRKGSRKDEAEGDDLSEKREAHQRQAVLLALQDQGRALLLYAPLETFLVSVARKGLHCRAWVRELLEGYVQDRFIDLGFAPEDYFRLTDLQVAAVGCLAQHQHFTALSGKHGDRIASLDADLLTARPEAAIAAVAAHYGLALDAAAVAAGPAFARNSKSGAAYSPEARSADYQAARAAYGEEIAMVVTWAKAVAANVGLALSGPNPLAVQA